MNKMGNEQRADTNSLEQLMGNFQNNGISARTEEGKELQTNDLPAVESYLNSGGTLHVSFPAGNQMYIAHIEKNPDHGRAEKIKAQRPYLSKIAVPFLCESDKKYIVRIKPTGIELTNAPISKEWEQELKEIADRLKTKVLEE